MISYRRFAHRFRNITIFCYIIIFAVQGCGNSPNRGYEIYRVQDVAGKIYNRNFDEIQLPDTPLISMKDIAEYDWQKHTISLTKDGINRIREYMGMGADSLYFTGILFVAAINRKPVYGGYFYSPIDSRLYIQFPVINSWELRKGIFQIEYQAENEDLINNSEIYDVLKKNNKIR